MPYTLVEDFRGGLDLRRSAIAAKPGTLRTADDIHITRGGEIEARKAFGVIGNSGALAGTYGLHATTFSLYVFGDTAMDVSTLPPGVIYQQLEPPAGESLSEILSTETFGGKVYVIAKYDGGTIRHYYDGEVISFWSTTLTAITGNNDIIDRLAREINESPLYTAEVDEGGLALTATVVDVGVTVDFTSGVIDAASASLSSEETQSAVVPVEAAGAEWGFRALRRHSSANDYAIKQLYVEEADGTLIDLINASSSIGGGLAEGESGKISWGSGQGSGDFCDEVAERINAHTTEGRAHGYTAEVRNVNELNVIARSGAGIDANDYKVTLKKDGISLKALDGGSLEPTFSGAIGGVEGVSQKIKFTVSGAFESNKTYFITLDGVTYSSSVLTADPGTICRTFRTKMYSSSSSLAYFSAINLPAEWENDEAADPIQTGAGSINISGQSSGSEQITAMAPYQGRMAFFGENMIQIWALFVDENNNDLIQTLSSTGTESPRGVVEVGGLDTFYLSRSGIRSLQVRDGVDAAFAADIGSAIDTLVAGDIATATSGQIASASAVSDPIDGRIWMSLGNKIYVMSLFRDAGVKAWTVYNPGFEVEWMAAIPWDGVYLRSGDTLYKYGGASGNEYMSASNSGPRIVTPFFSAKRPAHYKSDWAFDIACTGEWKINAFVDPNDLSVKEDVGTISQSTYGDGSIRFPAGLTHIAIEMINTGGGPATISEMAVHYETDGSD